MACGARDILTLFHCQVVDANGRSLSLLLAIHQVLAGERMHLVDGKSTTAQMLAHLLAIEARDRPGTLQKVPGERRREPPCQYCCNPRQ